MPPLNIGYIEAMVSFGTGSVIARIYYDSTIPSDQPQPLINGPRGFCLDVTNTTGATRRITYTLPDGTVNDTSVPQGNPVSSRSLTANQLRQQGYELRSDVVGFGISG